MKFVRSSTTPAPPPKKHPKRQTFTIGFRVDSAALAQLEQKAARTNISVHEYARQRVLDDLEEQDSVRLLAETKATQGSVEELRDDIAIVLEVLLNNLTSTESEKIRYWIDTHLRHRHSE